MESSIAVGALEGLSSVFEGKPGLLWMDAHGDFNIQDASPSGYIGGMCLAMACGRGTAISLPDRSPEAAIGRGTTGARWFQVLRRA